MTEITLEFLNKPDHFFADKNFTESLKEAMRTIVNFKEQGTRPKAPELLALYCDQLLKKVIITLHSDGDADFF